MPYASVFISFTVKPRFNGPVSHRILDKKIHTPFLRYRIQFATDGICWNPLERDLTVESKFCKCFVKPVNQRMLYQINQALSHFTQQWWQNLTVVVSRTWGLLNLMVWWRLELWVYQLWKSINESNSSVDIRNAMNVSNSNQKTIGALGCIYKKSAWWWSTIISGVVSGMLKFYHSHQHTL